jgi:hypothetical protein
VMVRLCSVFGGHLFMSVTDDASAWSSDPAPSGNSVVPAMPAPHAGAGVAIGDLKRPAVEEANEQGVFHHSSGSSHFARRNKARSNCCVAASACGLALSRGEQ